MPFTQKQALLVCAALSAATVLALPAAVSVSDSSLSPVTSLDVRAPDWDGSTGVALEERRNTVALLGTTAAYLSAVVVGTCSSPFAALIGPAPCVAATAAAAIAAFVTFAAFVISGTTKRDTVDWSHGGYFAWEYPAIAGGASMRERVMHAHDVEFNDGLPVLIGNSNCNEDWDTCHKLWYSKSSMIDKSGDNRTIHRVHATPHSYDFRANASSTLSALRPRQSTYDNDGSNTDNGDGTTYYSGYTWMEGDETVLAADDGEGTDDFTDDVLGAMNTANAANGKFNDEGSYCMDFDSTTDTSAGSLGFLWYYSDQADYPSANEQALLMTCGEEAAD